MLVWQVCLASVCLHIRRKATAFYAYLPVGGYVQFHSSPTAVQVYVGFSGCYVPLALPFSCSSSVVPSWHGDALSFGVSSFSYGDV